MPGVQRQGLERLLATAEQCLSLGVPVMALFPVIDASRKTEDGREATNPEGLVPSTVRELKRRFPELALLTVFNMFFWHTLAILAVQSLSSGRAAILGYTMPVFSAVIGALWFGQRLVTRAWAGVAAAALGVVLLLWHEITTLSGRPLGVAMMLVAAATWAVGTQLMRRTRIAAPTLAISFWMTVATTLWMSTLALLFERGQWLAPNPAQWERDPVAVVREGVEATRAYAEALR